MPQLGPYDTPLTPQEEAQFQIWKASYAPRDSGADYDLRGAFKAGLRPDPKSGHWPDTFKKPNHPTFSNESKYAVGPDATKAGSWTGANHDVFINPRSGSGQYKLSDIEPPVPSLAERQAASKATFEANQPTVSGILSRFGSPTGQPETAWEKIKRLGSAVVDAAPGAVTGMESPEVQLLSGATTGGAASASKTLAEALRTSPAAGAITAIRNLYPSAARAGEAFNAVKEAAKDIAPNLETPYAHIQRMKEISATGGGPVPDVAAKLETAMQPARVSVGGQEVLVNPSALKYPQTFDFASNAKRLSATELSNLSPMMQGQVKQFAGALQSANRDAAASVGMGDLFDAAMKEYRQAKTLEEGLDVAKKFVIKHGLILALGAGVGGGAAAAYHWLNP